MVMRNLRLVVILAIVAGCQSAPTVNPYPNDWLIDDFQGGDGYPAAPLFHHWECRPEDSSHSISECKVIVYPEKSTNKVLHLVSTLWPFEAGRDDFTRSEVASFTEGPVDVTPYVAIKFWAKLDVSTSLMPLLKVQLSCTHQLSGDGGPSLTPCVIATVITDKNTNPDAYGKWQEYRRKLRDFHNPENGTDVLPCLTGVDGIKITVDSDKKIESGSSASFDLYVDDIKFTHDN